MPDASQVPASGAPPAASTPPAPSSSSGTQSSPTAVKVSRRPLIVAAAGGAIVAALIGLVVTKSDIGFKTGDPARPTLSFVSQDDIAMASTTLAGSASAQLVDDAKRCSIPLAQMTIERGTAPIGSMLRIRSGSYVSPYFTVTDGLQKIAMPYPAPYGSGAGIFIVEGNATGAILGLTPTRILIDLPNTQQIPVVWRAVSPC